MIHNFRETRTRIRAGLTLVELLIVIAIMLVLVGIAIPSIRMLTRGDSVREAAREVNLFIESARSDAIANGFAGVWLERGKRGNKVTRIYKVKRPPKYRGDFANVKCYVRPITLGTGNFDLTQFYVYFVQSENTLLQPTADGTYPIKINDRIQIGGAGPWYQIISIPTPDSHPSRTDGSGNPLPAMRLTVALNTGLFDHSVVRGTTSPNQYLVPLEGEFTFMIERAPMISSREYLQLPKGTYVDLTHSGFAVDPSVDQTSLIPGSSFGGDEFANNPAQIEKVQPVLILFREDGSVDRVDYQVYPTAAANPALFAPISQFPRSNIFLLVVSEPENLDPAYNALTDLENLWVMISRTNGTVQTDFVMSSTGAATPGEARALARRAVRDGHDLTSN